MAGLTISRPIFPETLFQVTAGQVYPPACRHKPGPPRPPIEMANKEDCLLPPSRVSKSTKFSVILPGNLAPSGKRNSLYTGRKTCTLCGQFKRNTPAEHPSSRPHGYAPPRLTSLSFRS